MRKILHLSSYLVISLLLLNGCAKSEKSVQKENTSSIEPAFAGYAIPDSSAIVTYPNGLRIYKVFEGPGQFPRDGMNIRMNYHGLLKNGFVFDSTYLRDEPFEFRLGQNSIITGISEAVKKMRLGSKAVIMVPPSLGYGDGEDGPANIPANSSLIFHIELLGTF